MLTMFAAYTQQYIARLVARRMVRRALRLVTRHGQKLVIIAAFVGGLLIIANYNGYSVGLELQHMVERGLTLIREQHQWLNSVLFLPSQLVLH